MSNINPRPVHDAARDRRHVRRGGLHALDRHGGRHGHAGAGRQRLRCRRRHGLHAAGGGAAPVRAWRRRAGRSLCDVKQGKPEVICGQGPAPAGATIAHYRGHLGLDIVPGHGAAGGLRAGHVRDLHADAARPRHHAPARRAGAGDRLRANGHPLVERASATIATVEPTVPRALADFGRRLSAGRQGARAGHDVHQQAACRDLQAHPEGGRGGRRRTRGRDRTRTPGVEPGFRGRSDRSLLPHERGDGCRADGRTRACSRAGHGDLAADHRGAAASRLRQLPRAEAAAWTQGPVLLQMLALLKGFDLDSCRRPIRSSSTSGPSAPSSPMPTARRSTAIRSSSRCRWRRCCRRPTTPSGASSSARRRRWSSARATSTASAAASSSRAARALRRPAPASRRSRALHTGHGAGTRQRSGVVLGDTVHIDIIDQARQHVHGDAVGRLAAILARHSGAGLPARHARADVLARGRPAGLAGARQASALDAVGRHGAARGQAVHEPGARPAATSRTNGAASSSCAMRAWRQAA